MAYKCNTLRKFLRYEENIIFYLIFYHVINDIFQNWVSFYLVGNHKIYCKL